jgi:oxygen-independent coproporphyrinogen-3 oxidase
MPGRDVAEVIGAAEQVTGFAEDVEITLEANPGASDQGRFKQYKNAGVNRLSLGIQSFSNPMLQALGRVHSAEQALLAIDAARDAGFDNINLDLMYGLPGQTVEQVVDDLEQALRVEPEHLSWYQLTIEPNTVFHHQPPSLPEEENLLAMMDAGLSILEKRGYRRYEISAFSRPGLESRHNLNYWSFGDYIGIGAGAHGKQTHAAEGRIIRRRRIRSPSGYITNPVQPPDIEVADQDRPLEFMMNHLRLLDGFELSDFQSRTGLEWCVVESTVASLDSQSLLECKGQKCRLTPRGRLFLDTVVASFSS